MQEFVGQLTSAGSHRIDSRMPLLQPCLAAWRHRAAAVRRRRATTSGWHGRDHQSSASTAAEFSPRTLTLTAARSDAARPGLVPKFIDVGSRRSRRWRRKLDRRRDRRGGDERNVETGNEELTEHGIDGLADVGSLGAGLSKGAVPGAGGVRGLVGRDSPTVSGQIQLVADQNDGS